MKTNIRVGLLLDSYTQPFWVYKMLEEITKLEFVDLKLIVLNKKDSLQNKSILKKALEQSNNIFYQSYRVLEDKISKSSPNAFESKDIRPLINLTESNVLEVVPIQKTHSDYFQDEDVDRIKEKELDILIRLGFRILRGKILKSAKYGIWSYHHGDNKVNRGGPAGVWESIQGWGETGSVLQILSEDLDGGEVLYRSWSSTHRDFINKNLNNFYWKSSSFLPRTIKKLHELGATKFFEEITNKNQHPDFYSNRLYKKPTNFEFLSLMSSKFWSLTKYALWRLFNLEQWILLYSFKKNNSFSTSLFRYKKIIPPKTVYWADPCVVFHNNKHYIFFEEYVYKTKKAHISVVELSENGNASKPQIVLEKPYHLSYPFVFEHNGFLYLIPETAKNRTIELYRCKEFPGEWEFVMNLMEDVYACDTTIHFQDSKFWLFVNIKPHEGSSSDELFLYYSDNLLTNQWQSHPANPVVSDVKTARPAGSLFIHNNNLYRPSQDCAKSYGSSININHVLVLNEHRYEEVTVNKINPNWDKKIKRTHTFSFNNGLSVIDGFSSRRK